ncbi:hypothetical protein ABZ865_12890 [Streptomyces sp. NPDC047085]|uniref:hypothetical protein n=1 Tax=Streptomyces sp. NPDC047085 TaxID=3155140 RepID=UPI0033CB0623
MTASSDYQVCYVEQAAAGRDLLDARRRAGFDRGIAALARDPFPPESRAVAATEATRMIRLNPRARCLAGRKSTPRRKRQDNDRNTVGIVIYARRQTPATLIP